MALSERAVTGRGGGGYAVGMEGVVFGTEERRGEREAFRRGVEGRDWLAVVADNTPSGIFMMDPLVGCRLCLLFSFLLTCVWGMGRGRCFVDAVFSVGVLYLYERCW